MMHDQGSDRTLGNIVPTAAQPHAAAKPAPIQGPAVPGAGTAATGAPTADNAQAVQPATAQKQISPRGTQGSMGRKLPASFARAARQTSTERAIAAPQRKPADARASSAPKPSRRDAKGTSTIVPTKVSELNVAHADWKPVKSTQQPTFATGVAPFVDSTGQCYRRMDGKLVLEVHGEALRAQCRKLQDEMLWQQETASIVTVQNEEPSRQHAAMQSPPPRTAVPWLDDDTQLVELSAETLQRKAELQRQITTAAPLQPSSAAPANLNRAGLGALASTATESGSPDAVATAAAAGQTAFRKRPLEHSAVQQRLESSRLDTTMVPPPTAVPVADVHPAWRHEQRTQVSAPLRLQDPAVDPVSSSSARIHQPVLPRPPPTKTLLEIWMED